MKSFGRIGKKLEEAGHCVYASDTDGFGTIEHNAEQLKAQIERILEKEHAEKVNILAHSKGGLDSKYMISRLGMEDRVASLTTLSTPHRGSKLATWIFHMPRWISKFIAFWVNLWYRIFGDRKPDALTVCKQLQATPNDDIDGLTVPDSIFCQSFSGTMNRSRDDFLMSTLSLHSPPGKSAFGWPRCRGINKIRKLSGRLYRRSALAHRNGGLRSPQEKA